MKKVLSIIFSALFYGIHLAHGAAYKMTQSLPGSETLVRGAISKDVGGIVGYAKNLWSFGITIGGVLALAMIVFGAIEWTVSAGNESKISDAKDRITQAIIGLVLLFSAYVVLGFINPNLVQIGKIEEFLNSKDVPNAPAGPVDTSAFTTSTTSSTGDPIGGYGQFDTCTDCVPLNVTSRKPELTSWCERQPAPFNGQCYINSSLDDKLTHITENAELIDENVQYIWQITEAYPPSVVHQSQCHNHLGTCVDMSLKPPHNTCDKVALLKKVLENTGLKVLNEYPDCAGGTTTEFSTGGHLHVYL